MHGIVKGIGHWSAVITMDMAHETQTNEWLPWNSAALQERFPNVYREFFANCPVVCSAPRMITFAGEHVAEEGGFTFRQSLPVRVYVGVSAIPERTVRIAWYAEYDHVAGAFHERPPHVLPRARQITQQLLDTVHRTIGREVPHGFALHVLSEFPLERSSGGTRGALLASIVAAPLVALGWMTQQQLASWRQRRTADFISDETSGFDALFRSVWALEVYGERVAGGVQPFTALLPSRTPVFFGSSHASSDASATASSDLLPSAEAPYWGARAPEVFAADLIWPPPFDWGILSVPGAHEASDMMAALAEQRLALQGTAESARVILGAFPPARSGAMFVERMARIAPYLARSEDAWTFFHAAQSLLNWQIIIALRTILERGNSAGRLRALAEAMNRAHDALRVMELSVTDTDALVDAFRDAAAARGERDVIGARPNSTDARSTVMFIAPSRVLRSQFDAYLADIRGACGGSVALDYASWRDGYDEDGGLRIEQHLSAGHRSALLPAHTLQLHVYAGGALTQQIIARHERASERARDLLLDTVDGRVYIGGRACTSKELPSQKATIEILSLLLEHAGEAIPNGKLPPSAYATYRNELQGKIISPLNALLKKRVKKELGLKIHGKLTSFYATWNPGKLRIGILEPL